VVVVRGAEREEAVLTATLELLEEGGVAALTVDAVAARAHSSKATIYRRWSNKAELVRAAMDASDARYNAAVPNTGTLRGDFVAVMEAMRERANAAHLAIIADLVAASRHDPLLAEELDKHVRNEALSPFHAPLVRAVERGELPEDVDRTLIHDVAEALIMRQLQSGAPFDGAFVVRVVDQVLLKLLTPGGTTHA
jgi:AcrR family transcriptional regulator